MTSASLTLRSIQEGDMPFLAALYASTRQAEMAQVPWSAEATEAFLLDQFRLQHLHYQQHLRGADFDLVLVDGLPAGRRYVGRWPQEIRLIDLALMPAYQGRGFGRQLMVPLLEESEAKGLPLTLHVEQDNPVLRWYHRLGFKERGVNGVYVLMGREPAAVEVLA